MNLLSCTSTCSDVGSVSKVCQRVLLYPVQFWACHYPVIKYQLSLKKRVPSASVFTLSPKQSQNSFRIKAIKQPKIAAEGRIFDLLYLWIAFISGSRHRRCMATLPNGRLTASSAYWRALRSTSSYVGNWALICVWNTSYTYHVHLLFCDLVFLQVPQPPSQGTRQFSRSRIDMALPTNKTLSFREQVYSMNGPLI